MCDGNQVWDSNDTTIYNGVLGMCINCPSGFQPHPTDIEKCVPVCPLGESLRKDADGQCVCASNQLTGGEHGQIQNPTLANDDSWYKLLEFVEDNHAKRKSRKIIAQLMETKWVDICGPRHLMLWDNKKAKDVKCLEVCPLDERINKDYSPSIVESGCGGPVQGSPLCLPFCNAGLDTPNGKPANETLPDCGPQNMCPLGSLPNVKKGVVGDKCVEYCPVSGMIPNPWFTDFKQEMMADMLKCQETSASEDFGEWKKCGKSCKDSCPIGYGFKCKGGRCFNPENFMPGRDKQVDVWFKNASDEPEFDSPTVKECKAKNVKYNKACLYKIVDHTVPENHSREKISKRKDKVFGDYLRCGSSIKRKFGRCPRGKSVCVNIGRVDDNGWSNFCVKPEYLKKGCRGFQLKKGAFPHVRKTQNLKKDPLWEFSTDRKAADMCEGYPEPADGNNGSAAAGGLPHPIQSQKCVHLCPGGRVGWGPDGHTCEDDNSRDVCDANQTVNTAYTGLLGAEETQCVTPPTWTVPYVRDEHDQGYANGEIDWAKKFPRLVKYLTKHPGGWCHCKIMKEIKKAMKKMKFLGGKRGAYAKLMYKNAWEHFKDGNARMLTEDSATVHIDDCLYPYEKDVRDTNGDVNTITKCSRCERGFILNNDSTTCTEIAKDTHPLLRKCWKAKDEVVSQTSQCLECAHGHYGVLKNWTTGQDDNGLGQFHD